MNDSFIALLF